MVSFRLWRALHAFPVGFRRETGDYRRFPRYAEGSRAFRLAGRRRRFRRIARHDRVCAPLLLFGGQGLEKARRESHVRRLGRGLHTVRPRLTPLPDSARALHGRHRQRQLRARFRIHADQLDPPL